MKNLSLILSLSSILFTPYTVASDNPFFIDKMNYPSGYSVANLITMPESICGSDDLQHIEAYNNQYAGIGYSYNDVQNWGSAVGGMKSSASSTAGSYCSGSLIGTNQFLTASHCVGSSTIGHFVSFGYQTEDNSGALRSSQQFYRIDKVLEDGASFGLDYAVLKLQGNPGNANGDFPGADGSALGWNKVKGSVPNDALIIQHPLGQPKQVDAGTGVTKYGDRIYYSDIDTQPGSSGSSIFNDKGEVVGVHTNGGCSTSGTGNNSGISMQSILNVSQEIPITGTSGGGTNGSGKGGKNGKNNN